MNATLTALSGVKVGHATRPEKHTGVTVVLFDEPLPVAYACYGGSPGTLNTDALRGDRAGAKANAIFISGGSWAGLQSGARIASDLIEMGKGFKLHKIINPNVTGAIVLDLGTRVEQFDPNIASEAVRDASTNAVPRGNVGAGTGTAVGKFRYANQGTTIAGMKAGVGCARVDLPNGAFVTCLSVVNAVGNVVNRDGSVLAGNRKLDGEGFETFLGAAEYFADPANTTISIVGTNVALPNASAYERVAHVATHGQIRAINPVNLAIDGDTVFVFSTEEVSDVFPEGVGNRLRDSSWPNLDIDVVGQAAAEAVQESIYDACRSAEGIEFDSALDGVIPSCSD